MALRRNMTLGLLCFLLSLHVGYSQSDCPIGFYGPSCEIECDHTCVTHGCTVTDADTCGCDKVTGRCSKCISGWYTDECNVECVDGCDGACARSTGICEKCVVQTFGEKCELNCFNCQNGCDQMSGTCLTGCQVEHCVSCVTSIYACEYCTDEYGLDRNGTTCCSDGCISEDGDGYPECQPGTGECKFNNCKGKQFYGDYCKRCNTRIPNCETCGLDAMADTLECLTCSPSYVPTSTAASCCPDGCDSCNEMICTSCKPGWFLYDTRCDTCGDYCTPPKDGSERCDSVTGNCLKGCFPGWHGSACDVECTIENCNTCAYDEANKDLTCADCADTWYGEQCASCFNLQCAPAGECDQNGVCQGDCQPGYRGATCVERCNASAGMENCNECHRTLQLCTLCKPSYFGLTCVEACSANCVVGNVGDRKCDLNTGDCDLQCDPGYWQADCKMDCPNCTSGSCNITTGYCQPKVCSPGFYGVMCIQPCAEECANNPNSLQPECDVDTGVCTHGCAHNFYGDFCNDYCHENCSNKNSAGDIVGTYHPLCNQTDGACRYGCLNGSFTPQCSESCISSCVWDYCDVTSGICDACHANPPGWHCINADCVPGLWGNECDTQCASQLCLYNQCHRYDNVCKGCGTGDYGLYCNKSCGHCQPNSGCDQISGKCGQGCSAGWRGDMCMTPCDPLCQTCDRETGACIACVAQRWGPDCEEECSSHCDFISGNVDCEKDTGHCKSCEAGYWRPACTDTCPQNCKASDLGEKICTIDNGYCSDGCQLTYSGDRCQLSCSTRCRDQICVGAQDSCVDGCADGYWGPQCTHQCSSRCGVPGSCDSADGACYDGCEDGHYGRLCDSECIATCKNGQCDEQGSCPECPIGPGCRVQDTNECELDPCLNNGTCVNTQGSFKCMCPPRYEGHLCQTNDDEEQTSSSIGAYAGVGSGVAVVLFIAGVAYKLVCSRRCGKNKCNNYFTCCFGRTGASPHLATRGYSDSPCPSVRASPHIATRGYNNSEGNKSMEPKQMEPPGNNSEGNKSMELQKIEPPSQPQTSGTYVINGNLVVNGDLTINSISMPGQERLEQMLAAALAIQNK